MVTKTAQEVWRDRIKAAAGVVLLHALLGYALVATLGIQVPAAVRNELKLFQITPEPPPEPAAKPAPHRSAGERREDAPSPPDLEAEPTQVVAPPIPIVPPLIVAAPAPGLGGDPSAGAADVSGPGTGGGGEGSGRGGGGDGDGDYTPPERIRGRLKDSDYPRAAGETAIGKTMTVRFTVAPNGRATDCLVTQSSGNAILDDATCRAIERRYRYEPSKDAEGTAVPSTVVEDHTWFAEE